MERDERGIYCNPTNSFDGVGSFHNLADYDMDSIEFQFVEPSGKSSIDEEQGFEAVLDLSDIGKALRDEITISETKSEIAVQDWQLYQKEKLDLVIRDFSVNSTSRRDAVFKVLEGMGVKTFIVVSGREDNVKEIVQRVRDVIGFVSILKRSGLDKLNCCLLFQDKDGFLYNLVVPKEMAGPHEQYQASLSEFSCVQAMGALTVLSRTFACMQCE